uniref:Late embryogenesis abundant protein LEA-2 subgroup domain-containing protein n=2 Tax=Aegilops tauschii TaxID=37682 RepID=A0A453N2D0_AEGTS
KYSRCIPCKLRPARTRADLRRIYLCSPSNPLNQRQEAHRRTHAFGLLRIRLLSTMSHDTTAPGCAQACCHCCCNWVVTSIIIVTVMLVAAYAVVLPLRITAEDASLGRLALAGPNGTALAFNLSLTVGLFNRNWAMRAELTAPLESELSFAGVRFDVARLSDAGWRIEIHETARFRVEAGAEGADAALEAPSWRSW